MFPSKPARAATRPSGLWSSHPLSRATIAGQSKLLAIQKSPPRLRSALPFIEGTVRVLPSAAKQRPNLVAPLAHTTRALWRDRAERRSHGAAE